MCNPFAYLIMNLLGENTKRDKNTLRRFPSKACVGFAIIKNRLNKFQMLKLFQYNSYVVRACSDNACMSAAQGFVKACKEWINSVVE